MLVIFGECQRRLKHSNALLPGLLQAVFYGRSVLSRLGIEQKISFFDSSGLIVVLLLFSVRPANGRSAAEWRSRSIYQLLTDRFAPSNLSSARCSSESLTLSEARNYCGGTYRGATDHLDYIEQMGFNAIWISPIPSNVDEETIYGVGWHGYWLNNLYRLNEHFGSEEDLIAFVNAAHQRDIWVMLDVVANHVGPNVTGQFFPFNQSEHYHPLCFIEDYENQTQVCSLHR